MKRKKSNSNIPVCPNCNQEMIKIVYGMPTTETFKMAQEGKVFLGGCLIMDNQPVYHCNNCQRSYSKNLKKYFNEPNDCENEDI